MEIKLKEFFTAEQIEWKPQRVGISQAGKPYAMVLCYIQARAIQDRLDEVFGVMGWKDSYKFIGNDVVCVLSVWDKDKGQWIDKENGAEQTAIESFKGGISSAFKRVASSGYGIGRYLYQLDTTFAECSTNKPLQAEKHLWKQAKDKTSGTKFYWKMPTLSKQYLPKEKQNESK